MRYNKKHMLLALLMTLGMHSVLAGPMEDKIQTLESRLESLELKRDLDYVHISGSLDNRWEYIDIDDRDGTDDNNINALSVFAKLDIEATPHEDLTFYGRLSMAKHYNEMMPRGRNYLQNSLSAGRDRSNGAGVFVERAFINYTLTDALTLSAGRLPTIDGPPKHYSYDNPRMGTYPSIVYSYILDGLALSHLAQVGKGDLRSRLIYAPIQFANYSNNEDSSSATDKRGAKIKHHAPGYTGMLDYKVPGEFAFRSLNLIFLYMNVDNMVFDLARQVCSPATNYICVDNAAIRSNLHFKYEKITAHAEVNSIAKSDFDFALSVARSQIKSEGSIDGFGGVFTSNDADKKIGWTYITALRYSITPKLKIGHEYIVVEKDAFTTDGANVDAIGFYGTVGSRGHHLYTTVTLLENLKLTTGVMHQKIDTVYNINFLGTGRAADRRRLMGYANLTATF